MAKRIAVLSTKGGSSKTTTAVNLAASLAARGYRVAVVDADGPQHHSASWIGKSSDDLLKAITVKTAPDKASLGPALEAVDDHHFVVIDVIGADADVLSIAAANAHFCAVPMGTSGLEADGAVTTITRIRQVEAEQGRPINAAVLMTRCKPTTRLHRLLKKRITQAGAPLMTSEIQDRIVHAEAEMLGTVPAIIEPEGFAAVEIGILTNEILRRIGITEKPKRSSKKKETAQ